MGSRPNVDILEAVRNAATNPYALVTIIQQFQQRISSLESELQTAVHEKNDVQRQLDKLLPEIQFELSSRGRFPLQVDNLRGRLYDPQPALLLDFGSSNNPSASLYDPGRLAVFNGAFEYVSTGIPHTWKTVSLSPPTDMAKTDANNNFSVVQSFPAQFRSKAHNSGAQTITNGLLTALTFDTNDYDTGGVHSTTSNTSRFTVPTGGDGTWLVVGQVGWGNHVDGHDRELRIRKNGTTNLSNFASGADGDGNSSQTAVAIDSGAVANDYYEIMVIQQSGVNLATLFGSGYTQGQAYKLG